MARRILVVDDNVESVKLIGLMLESRGYEIVAAVSGAQALSKALSDEPDLIILDVMMPDMDGYEVCRRLRADPNTASLPVIMLTARTQISDKVAGFQAGVDDYLTKPIHPEELASRVAAVLQRTTNSDATIPSRRAKVIGFVGAKGGVGTTSVAINVGASLVTGQARDKRAVLAEMRSGLAAAGLFLGLRTDIGLSELLRRPLENTDGEAIDSQLQGHRSGLFVLCGQVEPPGVALPLHRPHAQAIVRHLEATTDFLLLDMSTELSEATRLLLPECDSIVVIVEPQRAALSLADALLSNMMSKLKIPGSRISVVVVNRTHSAASYTLEAVESALQYEIAGVVPPAAELSFEATQRGMPMVLVHPNSTLAIQVQAIASHLVDKMQ